MQLAVIIVICCPVYSAANWSCPEGYSRCYGSRQCVLDYFFNDGENDCNVGTDELGTTVILTNYIYIYNSYTYIRII